MNRIATETLALPIGGMNLRGTTLGEQLASLPGEYTLLAFLRHYGCMFGREMVRDVRTAADSMADYPNVVFVGQGNVDETRDYMAPTWPEASVICDPDRALFTAMELGRGTVYQMFGPAVWACHVRASFKGNFFGKFVGDPWIMPGVFVVDRSSRIVWQHEFRHQGDHPNWAKIPSLLSPPIETPRAPLAISSL